MRRNTILVILLLGLVVLLPVTVVTATLKGYQFELHGDFLVAGIATVGYTALCAALLRSEEKQYPKAVLIACLPVLSEINLIFYMWESGSVLETALSAIWIVSSFILLFGLSKSKALKITSTVLSVLLLIPIAFMVLTYFTIGKIGQDTVVNTVVSPEGTHWAEVIASSQGALGGDTVVQVYHEHDRVNLVVCEFQKVERVYIGEWGAHNNMEITWESEQELTINGNTCVIQ